MLPDSIALLRIWSLEPLPVGNFWGESLPRHFPSFQMAQVEVTDTH